MFQFSALPEVARTPPPWWQAGLAPREYDALGGSTPDWAAYVDRLPAYSTSTGEGLADALQPLLDGVRAELRRQYDGVNNAGLTNELVQHLGQRLVRLAARTLVLELNKARKNNQLAGETSADRFTHFTRQLSQGGLVPLLRRYPVLARVLSQACRGAVSSHLELLDRLATDKAELVDTFFAGTDPGLLISAAVSGDTHRGGRAVAILTFENGAKLVYRPRSLDLHGHFNEIVDWLNERARLDLRTVRLLPRQGYGWLEFVEHNACTDVSSVRRFYHRQGALLALLYVLDGTDMHYENLIASGEHPVLVDVETLFHPVLSVPSMIGPDPATEALTSSVHQTALLPLLMLGDQGAADMSGLGGDDDTVLPTTVVGWQDAGLDTMRLVRRPAVIKASNNRPMLSGKASEPRQHQSALLAGFASAYNAIAQHRDELAGPLLEACADDEVRLVAQATSMYATLLDESTHPDALRDGDTRDELFGLLFDQAGDDVRRQLVPAELADLWAGDIPLFTTKPGSRAIWTATGGCLPGLLGTSGLASTRAKIARLGEVDRHTQEWIISATLATRSAAAEHRGVAGRRMPAVAVPPDPQRLLIAATGIADEILARSINRHGRANWLGLELVDDLNWALLPMGAGLPSGYTGTALFLSQLAAMTGAERYVELARDALRPLPRLLDAMAADADLAEAVGPGYEGLGGIAYALARIISLDPEHAELGGWLDLALEIASALPAADASYFEGEAGGLAAMLAIEAGNGHPVAGQLARQYADRLLTAEPPSTGFARGSIGVGWALLRMPADAYREAGLALLHAAGAQVESMPAAGLPDADLGWCAGRAGTTVAAIAAGWQGPVTSYLLDTAARPALRDMSLCHGELGALEPLIELAAQGDPSAETLRARAAGQVLGAIDLYGPRCGTPDGVPSPGLLTGLAGIGYGLLRLGFPEVPSALLMHPPNVTVTAQRSVRTKNVKGETP
ncbi:type 2 lanthipeptide synthetase LanM family protein [Kribbella deserti]|uniref:Type 2 lanthipeptide synthetase LanM family protein n=1 Tax=Kribbella deserti TaxID=1926257 RepID=A0ABV6QQZ4_9ACTN